MYKALFHYQKGNYLRMTIPGLATFPVCCKGNSLVRIWSNRCKKTWKFYIYLLLEKLDGMIHICFLKMFKIFLKILWKSKEKCSLAKQMTGPEKSSTGCEMQVCTILSKVNSLFWQVSEADLEGQDEIIIKI